MLAGWIAANMPRLLWIQEGLIRFVLGLVFSLVILFRRAPETGEDMPEARPVYSSTWPLVCGCAGMLLVVAGLIFTVHQAEWLGILLLAGSGLAWGLPGSYRANVLPAFLLLYWIHPLPGQLFGPLENWLQVLAVKGTEWLLHTLNIRAWADGMVLRTGLLDVEVPGACSGLRAATTVILMVMGMLLLYRLPSAAWCLFLPLALVQTLILNIARISIVVLFARYQTASGKAPLHDAAGTIALIGVVVVYAELMTWHSGRQSRLRLQREPALDLLRSVTGLPPFWNWLALHRGRIWIGLGLLLAAGGIAFKQRPFHRAEMIKSVAMALRDAHRLDDAQRAAEAVARLAPYDTEWLATRVRLLLLQGRWVDALKHARMLPGHTPLQLIERQILQAYANMGLGRINEARALVATLPERYRLHDPQVAMVLAELALYSGSADEVVSHLQVAARLPANLAMVRNLYPFLRAHRRWQAIRTTDRIAPYTEPASAFAASEAYMNLDEVGRVASIVIQATSLWPGDERLIEPMYFMALRREGTDWETRFAGLLTAWTLVEHDPEKLYHQVQKCIALGRPDLAWALCRRIGQIDPHHPLLHLAAARYGDAWFTFRKSTIGMPAAYRQETFDAGHLYRLGLMLPSWRPLCRSIPFGDLLSGLTRVDARKQLLTTAIDEFQLRATSAPLSLSMQYEHIRALELADDTDGALQRLDQLDRTHPDQADRNRLVLSGIYEQKADWAKVYETLHGYAETTNPDLVPLLRLSRAQAALGMHMGAIYSARVALDRYPNSSHAAANLAGLLIAGNRPHEALMVANASRARRSRDLDRIEAEALYRTQRFRELLTFCRSVLLSPPPLPSDARQDSFLPPAELSLLWHRLAIPSKQAVAAHLSFLRREIPALPRSFVGPLAQLWLDAAAHCDGDKAEIERWAACGRTKVEKAMALGQLTMLRCFHNQMSSADEAAAEAVRLLPASELLWHVRVGLATNRAAVLREARIACPADPELWLADVVVRAQDSAITDAGMFSELEKDKYLEAMPPAVLARAGDLLVRRQLHHAATYVTRIAVKNARGLVPVYITGLRCAMATRDAILALESTTLAIEASLRPPVALYKILVNLKTDGGRVAGDDTTIQALRVLRHDEPSNALWAQMLGLARFSRGGWDMVDALAQMSAALDAGVTSKTAYVSAAEAARLLGDPEQACEYLRMGLHDHPGDLALENNLAFTLVSMPASIAEAASMIPSLLKKAPDNLHVLDTACTVYLRAGQRDKASALIKRILAGESAGSVFWFRAHLHAAELELTHGSPRKAHDHIVAVTPYTKGIPDEDVLRVGSLMEEIGVRLAEKKDGPVSSAPATAPTR